MEVFPNEEYWESLGVVPSKSLRMRTVSARSRAVSGWTGSDLAIATRLTGEIDPLPMGKPSILAGLVATRAPRARDFLALIRRYTEVNGRSAIRGTAAEHGFDAPFPPPRRLALRMFERDQSLLKLARYRSLITGTRISYPYVTSEAMPRATLLSASFKKRLSASVENFFDGVGGRRSAVEYVEAKRGGEAVTFALRYEYKLKRVEQWDGPHDDLPVTHAFLRVLPRYRMMEVVSKGGKLTGELASALSTALWGQEHAFRPISDDELPALASQLELANAGVELSAITIRSVKAENVEFVGSPTMEFTGADLGPTLRRLNEVGINLRGRIRNWSVLVEYRTADVHSECVVKRSRTKNRLQFTPEPPVEVKIEVIRRLTTGISDLGLK